MANIKKIALNGTSYDVVDATAVHTVDSALSSSSTNPVQNKVVYSALKNQPHFEYAMTSGYLQPTNFSGTFPTTFSALVSHADFEIALRNPVIVHYLNLTGSDDFVAQGLLWFGVNTQITDEWTILFSDGVTFQGALTNGVTGTMSYDSSEQVWYLDDATAHTPSYKTYTDDALDSITILTSDTHYGFSVDAAPAAGTLMSGRVAQAIGSDIRDLLNSGKSVVIYDDDQIFDFDGNGYSLTFYATFDGGSFVSFRYFKDSDGDTRDYELRIRTSDTFAIYEVSYIDGLDATISGLGVGKTITALSETNGVISAAASNIAIAGSQVTSGNIAAARMPTGYMKEAYLEWGGKNFAGDNGPLDAALIDTLGANRFAFIPGDCVTVEYSTDAGATWTDYGYSTGEKTGIFAPGIGTPTYLGKHNSTGGSANDQLRITVDTYSNSASAQNVYSTIKKMCAYVSTNGASGFKWTCQVRTTADVLNNVDTWTNVFTDVALNGWSGINIAQTSVTLGANRPNETTNTQYRQFRYIFTQTAAASSGMSAHIAYIMAYGGVGWSTPSNMAKVGSIYTYDRAQNVAFPARVKATELKGLGANYYGTCTTAAATAAKVVTCTDFVLTAGARISVKFTNGSTSTGTMTLNVNSTGAKNCGVYYYNGNWQNLVNRCEKNEVLEFVYDGTYWVTLTPYALRNFGTYAARLTSADRSIANFGLEYFLATSSMTTGKPPTDAAILGMHWDNGNIWGHQLAVGNGSGRVFTRAQNGSTAWGDWKELPRLSGALTNGQIVVSDESTGTALLKGGPTIDTTDTTKFLRHDGTWAEAGGGGGSSIEDKEVYLSRVTNFGDHKYQFPSLVGGTVAWNQLFNPRTTNFTVNGVTITVDNGKYTASGTATASGGRNTQWNVSTTNIEFLKNHKYFVTTPAPLQVTDHSSLSVVNVFYAGDRLYSWTGDSAVCHLGWNTTSGTTYSWSGYVFVIDLTVALGSTIANYIYSLETATAGAGVNWFRQYFPKSYYPYNAGALVSVNPTGMETVSRNTLVNGEFIVGGRWSATGVWEAAATASAGFNAKTPALSNTEYCFYMPNIVNGLFIYFSEFDADGNQISKSTAQLITATTKYTTWTSSSNTHYFGLSFYIPSGSLSLSYFADACFNISDSLNGAYTPPSSHSYSISPVELRGIPKLDSNNKLYYDGDVRASDGTVTRKYKSVVIDGTTVKVLNFGATSNGYAVYYTASGISTTARDNANLKCDRFTYSYLAYSAMPAMTFCGLSGAASSIWFILPSSVTSLAEANAWFTSNPTTLVYELATPTTEQAAPFVTPWVLADGGVQSVIDDRDVAMPIYQESTISDAQNAIEEMLDSDDIVTKAEVALPESGTCTLTDGMSISFTANYYKIGRQVMVWGTIPKYASTALGLSGLPYAASASMTSVVQFQNPASGAAMVSATLSVAAGYATLGVIGYITGSSNNGMFIGNSTGSWLNLIPSTGLPFNFTYITDTP